MPRQPLRKNRRKKRKRNAKRPCRQRNRKSPLQNAKSRSRKKRKQPRRRRKSHSRESGDGSAENRAKPRSKFRYQRSGTNRQFTFPSAISSHATLAGEPRFGRVTQPGFKNKTPLRFSLRGTCV